jgi:P-type conjugative transfer protein TrbJ
MVKFLALTSIIVLGSSAAIPKAVAQVVVACPTCSSIAEQLVSDAKQAQQYLTQVSQLETELRQYANMVTNTVSLPMQVFAGVQSDIMQIRNLTNAASLLTGNSGSILTRLETAGAYANQASLLPSNIGNQFTIWQQTLGNAGTSLGRTLGVQQGQEQSYTALQAAIQAHSQTAAGQMQAIQAGTEMAALTNTQLQQIQTTLVSAAQEAATRDEINADRRASQDAAVLQFSQYQAVPTTGSQGF